ncbi:MAG: alpha/beta hydrolase, partial [Myxococcales bacterium]|nr:alpha/beta hydrolase [Myxococcales bacterium]
GPGRTLAARVYRPAGDAPRPLVILLHGFQLTGDQYAGHGRRLASHGFIALLPTMGDGLLNPLSHVQLAADVSSILDWAEASLPGVDAARIGAIGHSRGGKQVILAAIQDERIRAVVGLDPVDAAPPFVVDPAAYPSVAPERMAELVIPAAFIGAGLGAQPAFPGAPACAPDGENHATYFASTGGPAWDYVLPMAGHLDFTDDCGLACFGCVAGADPAAARAFGWRTSVAFFQVHLLGDDAWRPWLEGPLVEAAGAVAARR